MTQKHNHTRAKRSKLLLIIPSLLVIALAATATILLTSKDQTETSSQEKTATTTPVSKFSFDATKVSGWRQGPTNGTSLALFTNDQSCFASIEYRTGTVDETTELAKTQASQAKDGYTSTSNGSVTTTLQTAAGTKEYELHQYSVTGSGSAGQLYGGQEVSYVSLDKGYLFIQGNCNTADQLSTTIDALQAIKFNQSN